MISRSVFDDSKLTAVEASWQGLMLIDVSFLQALFPLIICAVSSIVLLVQLILHIIRPRSTTDGYIKPSELPHQYVATADSLDNADVVGNGHNGDLDLISRQKDGPVVEVSYPWGETTSVTLEVAVSLCQVGIHVAALVLQAWGRDGRVAATAELVTWSYITLLACMRLAFTGTKRNLGSNLWNHTAILYGFQWMFGLFLFRSALIHPNSNQTKALVSTDFSLVSVLFLLSIISRKGNNPVILEFEGDLEPSREPLASLLSLATFSWVDVIVWKGYKKTFELSDVWNLAPKDRATKVLEDFRQLKRTSRLAWRLFKYFKWDLFIQACWALFSGLLTFVPTLLLKAILEYVENPQSIPASAGWLYVILLALSGIVSAVADGQALWIGRKICIRLRAIIIGEIYHKTLKRKAAASSDKVLGQGTEKKQDSKLGLKAKIVSLWRRNQTEQPSKPKDEQKVDSQTNAGTIINLMAVDAQKISEICAYLHFLFPTTPVQIIIAFTLLYQVMGYSSIIGIVIMLLLMPVNFVISNQFSVMQKKIMAATDGRIHSTNEVLSNIRIIKYFAWEQRFQHIVNDKRAIELRATRNKFILWTGASIVWYGVPLIVTTLSFLVYTVVEKKDLIPSVAFTALSLFSLLRYPLDRIADMMARVQASKVSVDRVDEFLNEDETEKFIQLSHEPRYENGQMVIGFDKATFTWGMKDMPDDKQAQMFRMINLDIRFQIGQLNIVAGSTGSGKTSLLMALLGEMTLLDGSVYLPGGYSREKLRPDPETGLTESVAYCAQQAWLVNADIKHNIVFASPWDSQRYENVIEACALRRDLEVLEAGDQTLVGEKGIVVSGGQKQRISLARALYCNAKHVLLDDCLSAVDSHTAQHIFLEAIKGPLMLNRTCILVTHNVGLCVPKSSHIVVLANGKITAQGPPEVIMSTGALGTELSRPASRVGTEAPTRTQSTENLEHKAPTETNGHTVQANGHLNGSAQDSTAKSKAQNNIGEAKASTEAKSEGSVKWRVMQMYLAAMGSWYFWICIPIAFACETLAGLAPNVWIRQWANSYSTKQISAIRPYNVPFNFEPSSIRASVYTSHSWINFPVGGSAMSNTSSTDPLFATSGQSMSEVGYYLGIYVLLGLVYLCCCVFRLSISFKGSLNASRSIHNGLLEAITRAKFKFFDTTPLGQITNRFSTDLSTIDQETNLIACGFLQGLFNGFAIVLLISIITPGFLVTGAFLTLVYFCIGMFYINSSRDLKRLESVQRSPLYQQFGETLSGITTIRAYGDEDRFIRENATKVNNYNRPFIYLWSTNRWLAFRVDFAGSLVSFFAATFIILNVNTIDSGAAGLSLTYALLFNENICEFSLLLPESTDVFSSVACATLWAERAGA